MTRLPLLYAVLFAIAHTQSPVPFANQNQYLLHGVAAASDSPLRADWLATTADPTPAFSALVQFSDLLGGSWLLHAVFFVALAGYFLAAWQIANPATHLRGLIFALLFTVVHAGVLRWLSGYWLSADYLWFFQCGLANQYILGPGLQPSVVGVLLLAAVASYRHERPVLATALAAGTTLVHTTYLLPAGVLVAGFVTHLLLEKQRKLAVWSASVAVLLVLPSIIYTLAVFAPTDAATFAESQRILAEVRIPHHCRPARWFDWVAGVQIAWMLLGLWVLRKSRLFVPLMVATGLAVVGTAVVLATNHPTLSLLFPWRITAMLVPVSTAAVLMRAVGLGTSPPRPPSPAGEGGVQAADVAVPSPSQQEPLQLEHPPLRRGEGGRGGEVFFAVLFALLTVVSAAVVYALGLGYREPISEGGVFAHVSATRQPEHVYLIRAKFPAAGKDFTGVYSKTFTPPDPQFSDLARFRLATRARLFADFKAIPYKDADVLEWHRRVAAAERWYARKAWDDGIAGELAAEGITHAVVPASLPVSGERWALEHEDDAYRVWRVKSVSE